MAGRSIIVCSWATTGAFVVTIVPDALGLHALDTPASVLALALFLVSLPIWLYAFGLGVVRSGRGDDVGVGGLFFLSGSAPSDVRRQLFGSLALALVVGVATAVANAFAVLEPMLPLALMGLWAARHGTFPPRPVNERATGTTRERPGAARPGTARPHRARSQGEGAA